MMETPREFIKDPSIYLSILPHWSRIYTARSKKINYVALSRKPFNDYKCQLL